MARRNGGTNDAMVDKLKRFQVITSRHVEEGFRRVDRKKFVPKVWAALAYSHKPLRAGNVHISVPHIYGSSVEALDLVPNSTLSFLNVGSGSGYLSCIAAEILGPNSLNYGIELHDDVIEHCKESISEWKASILEEGDGVFTFRFLDGMADIRIVRGNGLNILEDRGESVAGFDRIYVGAAVDEEDLTKIVRLLSPGGILVGPVCHHLVKIVRTGNIPCDVENDYLVHEVNDAEAEDAWADNSLAGILGDGFTIQMLSGVRFFPLDLHPAVDTVIPANVWNPSNQRGYPLEFKSAYRQLMMCSKSKIIQPLPVAPARDEQLNAAAMLPKSMWIEILSYTHRKWFEPEQNEADYLRRRLKEEKTARREAEDGCLAAEARCLTMEARCRNAERQRTVYRVLARRWRSRLDSALRQQDSRDGEPQLQGDAADGPSDAADLGGARRVAAAVEDGSTLADLIVILQQLHDAHDRGGDGEFEEEEGSEDGVPGLEDIPEREDEDHEEDLSEGGDDVSVLSDEVQHLYD